MFHVTILAVALLPDANTQDLDAVGDGESKPAARFAAETHLKQQLNYLRVLTQGQVVLHHVHAPIFSEVDHA